MDGGNVLPKLKSATGPLYKHFKHEMASRERDIHGAIARINVDTELSPFLRQQLGNDWKSPSSKKLEIAKQKEKGKGRDENKEIPREGPRNSRIL